MNIGYVKLGKRIKLKEEHGIGNGDFDVKQMLKLLSLHFPNDRILLIGANDLEELSPIEYHRMFPNENVELFNGDHLDFTISLVGPHISDEVTQPQIEVLNNYSDKVIEIVHDKRFSSIEFFEHGLSQMPIVSLGQATYSRQIGQCKIDTIYSAQECLYLYEKKYQELNREKFLDTFSERINLLVIAIKEINSTYRKDELEKYVFSQNIDFHLWGTLEDDNYKGAYQMCELPEICSNYKFSFCVPVVPGFATSKYIEMLHNNCFPFLHPDYGQTILRNKDIHKIKYVSDLTDKIKLLTYNPNTYFEILKNYKSVLSNNSLYSGKLIADTINEVIEHYA